MRIPRRFPGRRPPSRSGRRSDAAFQGDRLRAAALSAPGAQHELRARALGKGVAWSFAGQFLPAVLGLLAVPILLEAIGAARFGALSLILTISGYFNLFDLGLGRALVQGIARRVGEGRRGEIRNFFATGTAMLLLLGAVSGALLILLSGRIADFLVAGNPAIRAEMTDSIRITGLFMPFVLLSTGMVSLLTALHRQAELNLIRIPSGIAFQAAPLLVVPWSPSLVWIVVAGCVVRVVSTALQGMQAMRILREGASGQGRRVAEDARELVSVGGWMMGSNLLATLFMYADRFVLGRLAGLEGVATYAVAMDLLMKVWALHAPVAAVLFPAFSHAHATSGRLASRFYRLSLLAFALPFFPIFLSMSLLGEVGMRLWIGGSHYEEAARILGILCAGVLLNLLANLPSSLMQAAGRASTVTIIAIAEAPAYAVVLILWTRSHGVVGAAWAWSARVAVDSIVMFVAARRILGVAPGSATLQAAVLSASATLLGLSLVHGWPARAAISIVGSAAFGILVWRGGDVRPIGRLLRVKISRRRIRLCGRKTRTAEKA